MLSTNNLFKSLSKITKPFHRECVLSSKLFQENHGLTSFLLFHSSAALQREQKVQHYKQHANVSNKRNAELKHNTKKTGQYLWNENTFLWNHHLRKERFREKRSLFFKENSAAAIVDRFPSSVKPYLRLIRADKPIGTLLLYFPCAFSIGFATPAGQLPSFYFLGLFGIGAFLMRGAGCIINDLWDRDFDKKVERTKDRPLASGAVSPQNAIKLLAVKLTLSLGILLSLNSTCIMIGFASMLPVMLYPLAKRYTYFPQLVLGLTFNIGAIMGYTAVTGYIDWALLGPLYASCVCWTLYYDTVYAFQDVHDDERLGIKSTARLFPQSDMSELNIQERMDSVRNRQKKIAGFLTFGAGGHLMLMALSGWSLELEGSFSLAVIVCLFRTIVELMSFDPANREKCGEIFNQQRWHGLFLLLGIFGAIYLSKRPNPSLQKSRDNVQQKTFIN